MVNSFKVFVIFRGAPDRQPRGWEEGAANYSTADGDTQPDDAAQSARIIVAVYLAQGLAQRRGVR